MKQLLLLLLAINLYALDNELKCMQLNIYHEGRSSSLADRYAIADVVMNRVISRKFPNTVCGVVKQAKMSPWWKKVHNKNVPLRNRCQFSWFCDKESDAMLDTDAEESAYLVAYQVLYGGRFRGITEGADHYFAHYIKPPYWSKRMNLVGRIGSHIYYKSN